MNAAPIPLLYADEFLVVCQKPVGVSSEAEGMPALLRDQLGAKEIFCVHRLDKAVGGVMVYARDGKTAAKLSELVSSRRITKEYLAVVQGVPPKQEDSLRDLLFHDAAMNKTYVVDRPRRGVKEAVLDYRLLQSLQTPQGSLSLLLIRLGTGRSHQIRAQFASRKMPLAGDRKYGSALRDCGIALLSQRLAFPHPVSGKTIDLSLSMPEQWPWTLFSSPEALRDTEPSPRSCLPHE